MVADSNEQSLLCVWAAGDRHVAYNGDRGVGGVGGGGGGEVVENGSPVLMLYLAPRVLAA